MSKVDDHYRFFLVTRLSYCIAREAASKGDREAKLTADLIDHTFWRMHQSSMECMCRDCGAKLDRMHHPAAFALCIPLFPPMESKESFAITLPVCEDCSQRLDLEERMMDSMRELCPSVTLVPTGGRLQ